MYGEVSVVATLSQPEISVPVLLKATVPGAEVVAVIVSIVPYVGVAALRARLLVVEILDTEMVNAACVLGVEYGSTLTLEA